MDDDPTFLKRRDFLMRGAKATLGALALDAFEKPAWAGADPPRIRRLKKLGKTGLEISDIGMGTGALRDPDLVRHALERGITYFDTAESYPLSQGGLAERALGVALQGQRERVTIATKIMAQAGHKRAWLMKSLENSLKRLRTDRVEIFFNHAVNSVARLKNDEWFEFARLAKQQGKIRFTGMSGHGGRLSTCLDFALDNDLVDVILVAHNFGQDPAFYERFTAGFDLVAMQPELPRLLAKAHAKGVGTIAMKTLRGARLNDMKPYETGNATYAQAAFRWVLSNPNLDAMIVSMKSKAAIDLFVGGSGWSPPSRTEIGLLKTYVEQNDATYCRTGCNTCESSCPKGVAISDVLRARMYAEDYGEPEIARSTYAALGSATAAACLTCDDTPCLGACPFGLEVSRLTKSTPAIVGSS